MFQDKIRLGQGKRFVITTLKLLLFSLVVMIAIGFVGGIVAYSRGLDPILFEQELTLLGTVVIAGVIWRTIGGQRLLNPPLPWSGQTQNLIHLNVLAVFLVMVWNGMLTSISEIFSGGWSLMWSSFTGALVPGIGEETWMRGILFSTVLVFFVKKDKPILKTALVTSFLFGALHLLNLAEAETMAVLQQVFYASAMGFTLAVIRVGYDNLWLPIFLHFLLDFQPTINEPVTTAGSWAEVLLVFLPLSLLSLWTLVKLDKDLLAHSAQDQAVN